MARHQCQSEHLNCIPNLASSATRARVERKLGACQAGKQANAICSPFPFSRGGSGLRGSDHTPAFHNNLVDRISWVQPFPPLSPRC